MPFYDTDPARDPPAAPSGWLDSGEPAWQALSRRIAPLVERLAPDPEPMPASGWLRQWTAGVPERQALAAAASWQPADLAWSTAALARAEVLRSMGRGLLGDEPAAEPRPP